MSETRMFTSFVVCGGIAACVNLGGRWILSHRLPYPAAITLAYLAGMLTGFLLFKFCVFDSGRSGRLTKETLWYIGVNLFALAQTLGISILLAEHIFPWAGMDLYPHDIAHCIGVMIPVITSYLGHKYCTFK